MRHVLGLAASMSAIPQLKPTFSSYRPAPLVSRSLYISSSLSSKSGEEEKPSSTRIRHLISRLRSEIVDNSEIKPAEPSPSTKVTDAVALGQEKQELSPASPQDDSASLEKAYEPEAFKALKRKWTSIIRRNLESDSRNSKMHAYIQFITTPTSDTPGTALLLHFDDRRYIIGNIHEGLQRANLQMGARVSRIKDMLLTGKTEWHSTGGLLGMILSIADASAARDASRAETNRLKRENNKNRGWKRDEKQEKNLNVKTSPSHTTPSPTKNQVMKGNTTVRLHGGPNLTHMVATARAFILRKGTPIKVLEHTGENKVTYKAEQDWEPTWSDRKVQVWAMPIKPSSISKVSEDPKPESLRKRSLGEYMSGKRPSKAEVLDQWSVHSAPPEFQDDGDQRLREYAVSEMFSSAWSHDDLTEMPLREVKMPAGLFVRDHVTKELKRYSGPTPNGTTPIPDINVLVRQAWPGTKIDSLPPAKRSSTAMSYIFRNHRMRGKFMPAAADELNIPPGPLRAALASGSSVLSRNGVTVTPDMVLAPSKEGTGVAVIDLPSTEYVHDLVNRPEWRAAKVMRGVAAIIWILGPRVAHDESLIKFIKSQPHIEHVISSPEHCPNYISMTSAASAAIRHHQIDPARYAIPLHSNAIPSTSGAPDAGEKTLPEAMFQLGRPAKRGLRINLEPKFEISEEAVSSFLNTELITQEASQTILDLSLAARQQINSPAGQAETRSQNIPSPDAEITCLGTGSAMPSQHRNVAASLLRVPGCGSYLMDCGENTLGQLKRMYTVPQLAELFQDLKLIWISHLHADHHLGLASVIKAWYEEVHGKYEVKRRRPTIVETMVNPAKFLEDDKRLFIVGHGRMMRWLEEYSSVEDFGYDQLVPLVSLPSNISTGACNLEWNGTNVGFNVSTDPIASAIRKATGLSKLVSCAVRHCFGSQAVSLTFPTGFKFSYSGDCRPSKTFAEIGQHSTVLLHEATFDDELKGEALAKKHSTTSEAIGVGVAMRARRMILTHFSQRYQKVPSMSALDPRSVKLEDTEDVDDPLASMDEPVDESTSPVELPATIDNVLDSVDDTSSQGQTELQPPKDANAPDLPSATPTEVLTQPIASSINPAPRPQFNDMRIGVAFDYMRVKVGDIIHLDKFTPALVELYKDIENGAVDKEAAKETFSDDENDMLQKEQQKGIKNTEKNTQEGKAENAGKGQIKAGTMRHEDKIELERKMKSMNAEAATEGLEKGEPTEEKMRAVQ